MKVIITYASAGTGHLKAAEAVYKYLKENYQAIDVRLVDILEETNALFKFNYCWGYSHLIQYIPIFWQWAFWVTYNRALRFLTRPVGRFINQLNTIPFSSDLIREDPDFIISTHFLPSEIAVNLKKSKKITSRLITVITDFGVHPFWVTPGTDIYAVASDFTKKELISEGVKEEIIKVIGIPIDQKFVKGYDRGLLCAKQNISPGRFTVLIITGSFGIGPIEEIADLLCLDKDIQAIVVCARNKRLYARLKNRNYQNLKVFGFVDNVQELMAVSSMIVTKPGGLSISELLAMELPPVFISPIPGQETANIKALNYYSIGLRANNAQEIKRIVLKYKGSPQELEIIRQRIRKIKKPHAAEELCNVICQDSAGISG